MTLLFIIYLIILGICVTIGLLKYSILDNALKVWFWMLLISLMSEIVASYVHSRTNTKAPVYHFYNIFEITLTGYYFITSIFRKKPKWLFIAIPLLCTAVSIGNLALFQSLHDYNTNVIIIYSPFIIGMALYALYTMMIRDDIDNITVYPHFHIWTAILILWTGTFFFWAFLSYLKTNSPDNYRIVAMGQVLLNITVYAFIGYAYYMYKKPPKLITT